MGVAQQTHKHNYISNNNNNNRNIYKNICVNWRHDTRLDATAKGSDTTVATSRNTATANHTIGRRVTPDRSITEAREPIHTGGGGRPLALQDGARADQSGATATDSS